METRGTSASGSAVLEILRAVGATLLGGAGAVGAAASLEMRKNDPTWIADRYTTFGGVQQLYDTLIALGAGAVLAGRLAWLLISALLWMTGRRLSMSGFSRWDTILVGAPAVLLGFLIYVANVRDTSFLPFGVAILVLFLVPFLVSLVSARR
jgi:hypothetical protein